MFLVLLLSLYMGQTGGGGVCRWAITVEKLTLPDLPPNAQGATMRKK